MALLVIKTAANVYIYYKQYQILSEKVNLMLLLITAQDKTHVYTLSLETTSRNQ